MVTVMLSKAQKTKKSHRSNRLVWVLLGMGISTTLVIYLIRQIDFENFLVIAKGVPTRIFMMTFVLYLLLNVFRALRFRVLLDQNHLSLGALFSIALYHNFLGRTLPFLVGEASYIILLHRYLKQPVSKGISSLLGARLFELIFVILGGIVGLLTMKTQWTTSNYVLSVLPTCALITLGGTYFSGSLFKGLIPIWTYIVQIGPWRHLALLDFVKLKLVDISSQLDLIRRPRLFLKTFAFSICTYGISLSLNFLLLKASGINQGLGVSLVVITTVMIASWFPFALSGFGVIEGSWAASLVILAGLETKQAISVGFFIHGCQVFMNALSGLLGFVLLTKTREISGLDKSFKS